MSRTRFLRTILLAFLLCLRNAGQLAFLAGGRRRARRAWKEFNREQARIHADLAAASFQTLPEWDA